MADSTDGAEFTALIMSEDSGNGLRRIEHFTERIMAGDVDVVSERLAFGLRQLDYRIQSEQPFIAAKRNTGIAGKTVLITGNALPYVSRLTINLKPLSTTTTVAAFEYQIAHAMVTKGDRQTIELEVDAIVALASGRENNIDCASCGTINTPDAKFCRVCGAPNEAGFPAEIEVLRLTGGARAAHQNIVGGAVFMIIWAAFVTVLFLLSNKGPASLAIALAIGEAGGGLWLTAGIYHLHRTLNPSKDIQTQLETNISSASFHNQDTVALPPLARQSENSSVTEGTTELLKPVQEEKAAISHLDLDTNELQ